jgi:hypothetical protein
MEEPHWGRTSEGRPIAWVGSAAGDWWKRIPPSGPELEAAGRGGQDIGRDHASRTA